MTSNLWTTDEVIWTFTNIGVYVAIHDEDVNVLNMIHVPDWTVDGGKRIVNTYQIQFSDKWIKLDAYHVHPITHASFHLTKDMDYLVGEAQRLDYSMAIKPGRAFIFPPSALKILL